MKRTTIAAVFIAFAAPAQADVQVTFDEGAPKDRFTFTNIGNCAIPAATLTLDLSNSAGALVFDVTAQGEGVEVFQPFDLITGQNNVIRTSSVEDGDKKLSIETNGLAAGDKIAFTIDVDDTIGAREITVTNGEISGATASVRHELDSSTAQFDGNSALISIGCSS